MHVGAVEMCQGIRTLTAHPEDHKNHFFFHKMASGSADVHVGHQHKCKKIYVNIK